MRKMSEKAMIESNGGTYIWYCTTCRTSGWYWTWAGILREKSYHSGDSRYGFHCYWCDC